VKGQVDPDTGFVMNFKELGKILKSEIIDKVDHKNLNLDVDFLSDVMPTCENLAIEFWKILEPLIADASNDARLHRIKLIETPGNFAEYYGEEL
jgi:6-pyruvoyltetrahydropterin/6-carboxytetrahydropterin synthase